MNHTITSQIRSNESNKLKKVLPKFSNESSLSLSVNTMYILCWFSLKFSKKPIQEVVLFFAI